MNNTREWVYMDSVKNIWKFELNENSNLVYKVMYDEEKWTKERMVAEDVVKYSIYIEDEIIHIIYINEKNEIKYCIFKNKQWLGKPIYNIDTNSTIVDLKTLIFQGKMMILIMAF
jgi:ribosomal protein L7Ae-like RNA K-turn-binding protein